MSEPLGVGPTAEASAPPAGPRTSFSGRLATFLPLVLFLLTVVTTLYAGAFLDGADPLARPRDLARGIPFSVSLLLILGVHEGAHYLASRRLGLKVTPPYFIPAPTIIGTMGAVIRIRSPIMDRRALLDVGMSGPLAGFAVSVPLAAIGLALSRVELGAPFEGGVSLGSSILFDLLVRLFAPGGGEGNLVLHPVAFAGWVGLLVTALNLLPAGQLDGGHIVCALFPENHRHIALAALVMLLPLGLVWEGWFIWAALLLVMGWRHPEPFHRHPEPTGGRRLLGYLALVILVLTFTPAPFTLTLP